MEVFRDDVKSGLFILLAAALFLFALFKIGGVMDSWKEQSVVTLEFEDAQQVTPGTEVFYRGMKIGTVSSVGLTAENDRIHMLCNLNPETSLFQGTTARVSDKSLLGGKLIELLPPTEKPFKALGADDRITGLPAGGMNKLMEQAEELMPVIKTSMEELVSKMSTTLAEVDVTLIQLRDKLGVIDDLKPGLETTLASFRTLADDTNQNLTGLTTKLNGTVDDLGPTIRNIETEITTLTTQLRQDLKGVTDNLNKVMASTDKVMGTADSLLVDNYDELTSSLKSLDLMLANLHEFSAIIRDRPSALVWKGKKKDKKHLSAEDQYKRELRATGYIDRRGKEGGQ